MEVGPVIFQGEGMIPGLCWISLSWQQSGGRCENKALALWAWCSPLKFWCPRKRFAVWLREDAEPPGGDHISSPTTPGMWDALIKPHHTAHSFQPACPLQSLTDGNKIFLLFALPFMSYLLFFFIWSLGLRHSCAHSSAPGESGQRLFVA